MNSFSLSNLLVFTLHKLCSGSSNVRKYVTTCVTTCVRNSCHWSTRDCAASCPYSVQSGICGYEIKESCVMFQMLWHFRHKYCVYSYLQHFLDFFYFSLFRPSCSSSPTWPGPGMKVFHLKTSWKPLTLIVALCLFFQCGICMCASSMFEEPVDIPCGHVFCRSCWERWELFLSLLFHRSSVTTKIKLGF